MNVIYRNMYIRRSIFHFLGTFSLLRQLPPCLPLKNDYYYMGISIAYLNDVQVALYVFFLLIAAEEDFLTLIELLDFHSDESFIDVNITIINDELTESSETFVIYLTSGAGVKLSPYAQTKVIIYDDDAQNIVVKGIQIYSRTLVFDSCLCIITSVPYSA